MIKLVQRESTIIMKQACHRIFCVFSEFSTYCYSFSKMRHSKRTVIFNICLEQASLKYIREKVYTVGGSNTKRRCCWMKSCWQQAALSALSNFSVR